jgi:hypothetical protein
MVNTLHPRIWRGFQHLRDSVLSNPQDLNKLQSLRFLRPSGHGKNFANQVVKYLDRKLHSLLEVINPQLIMLTWIFSKDIFRAYQKGFWYLLVIPLLISSPSLKVLLLAYRLENKIKFWKWNIRIRDLAEFTFFSSITPCILFPCSIS